MRADIYIKKNDAYFHAYDKLSCISFTNLGRSKLPLDRKLQDYIWKHKRWEEKMSWWIMDDRSILIYLLTRSILDKREFRKKYIVEIEKRRQFFRDEDFLSLCEVVFFKFTNRLIELLEKRKYKEIFLEYQYFYDY